MSELIKWLKKIYGAIPIFGGSGRVINPGDNVPRAKIDNAIPRPTYTQRHHGGG